MPFCQLVYGRTSFNQDNRTLSHLRRKDQEKTRPMRNAHKKFIEEYLKTLNASEAYRRAYPNAKVVNSNSCKLMQREDIKQAITSRLAAYIDKSKEEYEYLTQQLHDQEKNPSVKARYWEMLLKLRGILKDNDVNLNTTMVSVSSDDIQARISKKREALDNISKSE